MSLRGLRSLLCACTQAATLSTSAHAQDYFAGKTMTIVVGHGQGGSGYDVISSRVKLLPSADLEILRNAETLAEAKRIDIDVDPVRGKEIQAMLAHIYSLPTGVVIKARRAAGR